MTAMVEINDGEDIDSLMESTCLSQECIIENNTYRIFVDRGHTFPPPLFSVLKS